MSYETRADQEAEAKLLTAQARHMEAEIARIRAHSEDGHIALTMDQNEEDRKRADALAIRSHELAMKRSEDYQLYSMWKTLFFVVGGVLSLYILASVFA